MTWAVCSDPSIGFDVAKWQPNVPWSDLPAADVRWLVAKGWHSRWRTAEGAGQVQAAKAVGLLTGEYAWLEPEQSLDLQLGAWCATPTPDDQLPISIDFEQASAVRGRPLVTMLERSVETYSDRNGRRPIIYTGRYYWIEFAGDLDSQICAECPLWFAAYPRKNTTGTRYQDALAEVCSQVPPGIPRPWAERGIEPVMWQFDGDRGLYLPNGGDVDVNSAAWSRLRALVPTLRDTDPGPVYGDTPYIPSIHEVLDMVSQ